MRSSNLLMALAIVASLQASGHASPHVPTHPMCWAEDDAWLGYIEGSLYINASIAVISSSVSDAIEDFNDNEDYINDCTTNESLMSIIFEVCQVIDCRNGSSAPGRNSHP